MVQERFNNNKPTDSPNAGGVVIPEWAREYAAQQTERPNLPAAVASQTKADYSTQQPAAYDVEAMHARGRYINWLGDQYSRSQQNKDWYPGYGPGNGYYYPVRSMPVAPMPFTPIVQYPQPGNENPNNRPVNWPTNNNGEFPGQNGTDAFNPVRPPINTNQPYNWNNPSQPATPGQPFNPTRPGNDGNNPQNNQGFPGENGSNAYNNRNNPPRPQPTDTSNPLNNQGFPGHSGTNGYYNWNNPNPGSGVNPFNNQGFPGQGGNNAYYNWNNSSQNAGTNPFNNQGFPGQGGSNSYYNWNGSQPFNPFYNQGFPGQGGNSAYYNWNNPNAIQPGADIPFANQNAGQDGSLYSWRDAQQQFAIPYNNGLQAPWQGNSGISPYYSVPGMTAGSGNSYYNFNQPQPNPMLAWQSGSNNPFSNWRFQAPPAEQTPVCPDPNHHHLNDQPGSSTLSGMSLRVDPSGREYTHNHLTGEDTPWPPVEPSRSGPALNRQTVRPADVQTGGNSPQIVGMSLRVRPDGSQYTYNHVTNVESPWPPNGPDGPDAPERKKEQLDKPSGPYTKASAEHWQRTDKVIKSMVGHSIQDYDSSIPETLGCARFVSVVLKKADGLPTKDATVEGLENDVRKFGFKKLPLSQAEAGDVIIAHRFGDRPGHAAIYVGNDLIANNSSKQRKIAIESVNKFHSPEYKSVCVYRKVK